MDWDPPHTWDRHRAFLQSLPASLPEPPRALLVVSAHWEAPVFTVQKHPAPGLLFDYYGFPPATYALTWPAPGAPELADRITDVLQGAGLPWAVDLERGFDHGVFVPLKVAFAQADVPCLQLSLRADLDAGAHLQLGQALAPLRDEGVLILGSGNSYHNLPVMMRHRHAGSAQVHGQDFDAWLSSAATKADPAQRWSRLQQWPQAPGAREAVPRAEHLIPLMVAAGAAGSDLGTRVFDDVVMGAVQSAYRFG
ncbi:MAG: class III extradiol ring-cleavage dioxygenase [Rhodoferax sp.]